MSDNQTVIFVARSSQEAHLLRNLLAEEGINAMVVNAVLEQGGIDLVGWATAARVVVAEYDAPQARQIAMRFDRAGAVAAETGRVEEQPETEAAPTIIDQWPSCPECDAPRSTRCPICGTAGSDFAPVDMGFTWIPKPDDASAAAACSCGPGGCTPADSAGDASSIDDDASAAEEDEVDPFRTMLMCHTCDEPFTPEYPRLCEWCGHEFEDGFQVDLPAGAPEHLDSRVIAVSAGLLALMVALGAYFLFLV